jgi:hypothetical protein
MKRTKTTTMTTNNPNFFDGVDYTHSKDYERLSGQLKEIYGLMSDGQWRTVEKIEKSTGYPANSIQAQLRNLRKERFGAYLVERRRITESGLYEYRVGEKGASPKKNNSGCCKNCGKKL